MRTITELVCRVLALTMLTIMAEYLLPHGRLKNTACTAVRLAYIAAISGEIIGIFVQLGV